MAIKKVLSLVLVSALLSASVIGCGTAKKNEGAEKTDTNAPLKFTLLIDDDRNAYIQQSPDINKDKWVLELEKRTNVDLTIKTIKHDQNTQQFQQIIASGDIPDVLLVYGNQAVTDSVNGGAFWQLDDLISKNKDSLQNLTKAIPQKAWDEAKAAYGGKTYGVPVRYSSVNLPNGAFIRKDLLQKYNLQVPVKLDEWVNVLKVFKDNGVKYPFSGRQNWDYTSLFMDAFGVALNRWNLDSTGKLVPDIIRPEMKEALAFYRSLKEQGLMDPESLTNTGTTWNNKIKSGQVGMYSHIPAGLGGTNTALKAAVPGAEFELVPAPVGPKGAHGASFAPSVNQALFINKNFKDPVRVLQWLDKLSTEDMQNFMIFGNDTKTYTKPADDMTAAEESFRSFMRMVADVSYTKQTIAQQPNGTDIAKWFTDVAPKEGYAAFKVMSTPQLQKHPDLDPNNMGALNLWQQYAAQILLGQKPVDSYDTFVKEYLSRGGQAIIDEANEIYKSGKWDGHIAQYK